MAQARPTTIAGYIDAAPVAGQAHLRRLHALLKQVAPSAQETIKWNMPFFVEPRFLFAFAAHKAHLSFAPGEAALAAFRAELAAHSTTENMLRVPYAEALPEALIRKVATWQLRAVRARKDDAFW